MKALAKKLSATYASGSFGALIACFVTWFCVTYHWFDRWEIDLHPPFGAAWLSSRVTLGGLGGFLFLLPFFKRLPFIRGILLSLIPSAIHLFVVYPLMMNKGMLGADLGKNTLWFTLASGGIWGLGTELWLTIIGEPGGGSNNSPGK